MKIEFNLLAIRLQSDDICWSDDYVSLYDCDLAYVKYKEILLSNERKKCTARGCQTVFVTLDFFCDTSRHGIVCKQRKFEEFTVDIALKYVRNN